MVKPYDAKGEIAFGSQIRSYVFQPYTLVREERDGIDMKTPAVKDVLDGDFDQFMHAYLRHKTAKANKAEEVIPGEPRLQGRGGSTHRIRCPTPPHLRAGFAMIRTIDIPDLAATEAFGRRLGELLFPGRWSALVGQLGAGKTHLTRAIAEGLGVKNPAAVNSPTFVLIQEYPPRLPIYHFDAYRLSGPREFAELGRGRVLPRRRRLPRRMGRQGGSDAAGRSPADRDRDRGREPAAVHAHGDREKYEELISRLGEPRP